ncbi:MULTISPECIES: DUF1294 domain-containing protein [unclassified Caulobacter]|uniref:DUF1294 domain-containing protein n=1 Tax=unclassified Caulobacter TaxID=2648921 RepID=UPI000D36BACE|nr:MULTISPECIES: DUF1294 domain-containing protein [unclassified Caulobacter]PTS89439.1 DUF1294 domain-containing protein [Caulobacter sp. HMWF009]PTT04548.1 DUF1294 domain-containing protein [Caulobacter sp. HMWF025]
MKTLLGIALLAINLATFAAYGWDKAAAGRRGERRIPERTLLALAALGGSPAALLARHTLRHKTRKQPFVAWLFLIVFLQVAAGVAAFAIFAGRP